VDKIVTKLVVKPGKLILQLLVVDKDDRGIPIRLRYYDCAFDPKTEKATHEKWSPAPLKDYVKIKKSAREKGFY